MVALNKLLEYSNALLSSERFNDFCPNGLQVQGRPQVKRLVSGVTASQALIDAAIAAKADALLVHHGYFWKGESSAIVGIKHRRIKALIEHDISLIAYHLPLDAHPEYGNNAALARELDWQVDGVLDSGRARDILFYGHLLQPLSLSALSELIAVRLGSKPLAIKAAETEINKIAWCTGAAQGFIEEAVMLGVDAYISGEISEPTTHIARESGVHYIAAGHHATERYGAKVLAEHLAQQFGLHHQFIDIDNPV